MRVTRPHSLSNLWPSDLLMYKFQVTLIVWRKGSRMVVDTGREYLVYTVHQLVVMRDFGDNWPKIGDQFWSIITKVSWPLTVVQCTLGIPFQSTSKSATFLSYLKGHLKRSPEIYTGRSDGHKFDKLRGLVTRITCVMRTINAGGTRLLRFTPVASVSIGFQGSLPLMVWGESLASPTTHHNFSIVL